MPPASDLSVAEYFSGIGLMRLGLAQAGWKTLFANEIDGKKVEMYRHHFGPSPELVHGDIHRLQTSELPTALLATASFPCNDLSLAGGRKGLSGSQSSAFWGFIRILKGMGCRRPPMVLLENVPGFLTSHAGADFEAALLALNGLGYIVDAFMIDAARFVPQSRLRMFVVGRRKPRRAAPEAPSLVQTECRPPSLAEFILSHPNILWNLRNLPELPHRSKTLREIIEDLPPNSTVWWSENRRHYLLDQMSPKHRAQAEEMIHGPRKSFGTVFRRVRATGSMAELRTDGIAGCLRTPRGGSGRQILFVAGRGKFAVRLLTGRECAFLMGADDFRLDVPLNQALFGFGDAVCVPVIKWIADHYLNPLAPLYHADVSNSRSCAVEDPGRILRRA